MADKLSESSIPEKSASDQSEQTGASLIHESNHSENSTLRQSQQNQETAQKGLPNLEIHSNSKIATPYEVLAEIVQLPDDKSGSVKTNARGQVREGGGFKFEYAEDGQIKKAGLLNSKAGYEKYEKENMIVLKDHNGKAEEALIGGKISATESGFQIEDGSGKITMKYDLKELKNSKQWQQQVKLELLKF